MSLIPIYDLQSMPAADKDRIMRRARIDISNLREYVRPIIQKIRSTGDQAILEYIHTFDNPDFSLDQLVVSPADIEEAYRQTKPEVLEMIRRQISLSRTFFAKQNESFTHQWSVETAPGVFVGEKTTPIEAVGLTVPAGQVPLPTVAQILTVAAATAKVPRIVVVFPPTRPNWEIIVAAHEAGVHEMYRVGGVAGIAALTYGTQTIKPVLKIAGPGSPYTQAAKIECFPDVDIDMPAGPSEGISICDSTCPPEYAAAGILARCEHSPDASFVMVCWDKNLIEKTVSEIEKQLQTLTRKDIIQKALQNYSAIILVKDKQEAIDFTNDYAPEHLELLVQDPENYLPFITNSGSTFMGYNTTVPLGDYASGTSHVLPTGGWAKMFSPVGVQTFLKRQEFQSVTSQGLAYLAPIVKTISEVEELDAHWNSVNLRVQKDQIDFV